MNLGESNKRKKLEMLATCTQVTMEHGNLQFSKGKSAIERYITFWKTVSLLWKPFQIGKSTLYTWVIFHSCTLVHLIQQSILSPGSERSWLENVLHMNKGGQLGKSLN